MVSIPKSTKKFITPVTPNFASCQIVIIFLPMKLAAAVPNGVAIKKKKKIGKANFSKSNGWAVFKTGRISSPIKNPAARLKK